MNKFGDVRGFSLVELIVVILIIGILAVVLVPACVKYVAIGQTNKCNENISQMYNIVNIHKATNPECGLGMIFGGKCDELSEDFKGYKCPSGVKYELKYGKIYCSKHAKNVGEGTVPDTDMPLVGKGWPTPEMYIKGEYQFKKGEVFVHTQNGKKEYFVMTDNFTLAEVEAKAGPGILVGAGKNIEKVSDKRWSSADKLTNGKLQGVKAGDLYNADGGGYFIYKSTRKGEVIPADQAGGMPPEMYPDRWFKIPQ